MNVGIIRYLTLICLAGTMAGCVAMPNGPAGGLAISDQARAAVYPALLDQPALDRALALRPAETPASQELSARAAQLRARAAGLTRPVLTETERARLQQAAAAARP